MTSSASAHAAAFRSPARQAGETREHGLGFLEANIGARLQRSCGTATFDERRERVPQNPRWEYRRLGVPKGHSMEKQQEFDRDLADLGDDGWELVAVEGDAAYFKRQSAKERK